MLLTIALVLTRPRGVNEGAVALAGGLLLLGTRQLPPAAAWDALAGVMPVALFLLGLFWLTLACERIGLFDRATVVAVRAAGGSPRRLLALVFALGTLTTAALSNDATVVLLTPVVLGACRRLRLPPLPYLLACTFVADTASSLLPIANPVNLLFAERFAIPFARHALLLALPTLVAVAINAWLFDLLFRHQLPATFTLDDASAPPRASGLAERALALLLACVLLGYLTAALAGLDPVWVTLAGGCLASAVLGVARLASPRELLRVQPPGLYAFVAGLALVVASSDHAGLLDRLGGAVERAAGLPLLPGSLLALVGTAAGTNLVNNWTMALAVIPPLERAGAPEHLVFGALLGADIGPNLTVVGSLATLIWLSEVRRGGLAVSAGTYFRLGALTTIPAMLAGGAMLALVLWLS